MDNNNKENQNVEILKNAAKDVLEKLGYNASINVFSNEKDARLKVLAISSAEDPNILIGKNGQNMKALEHIIRLLYFRKLAVSTATGATLGAEYLPTSFMIDVNDYRKLRIKQIIGEAVTVASRVAISKKAEALVPMSSYERRLVHIELASCPELETESIGEEPERRVVIKPLIV